MFLIYCMALIREQFLKQVSPGPRWSHTLTHHTTTEYSEQQQVSLYYDSRQAFETWMFPADCYRNLESLQTQIRCKHKGTQQENDKEQSHRKDYRKDTSHDRPPLTGSQWHEKPRVGDDSTGKWRSSHQGLGRAVGHSHGQILLWGDKNIL